MPDRILVVEDDPMMRELITTRLALAGYETAQARNGHEGLERLAAWRPAAMILDINMPSLDGFGVLGTLRVTGEADRVRIMVMSARNQTADVRRAVSLGARDFLTKPFDDTRFLSRVARLLRRNASAPPAAPQPASIFLPID